MPPHSYYNTLHHIAPHRTTRSKGVAYSAISSRPSTSRYPPQRLMTGQTGSLHARTRRHTAQTGSLRARTCSHMAQTGSLQRRTPSRLLRCICVLQCVAVCCSVLQCVAVCCIVLPCAAACWQPHSSSPGELRAELTHGESTATNCNTRQHTASHCNALLHTVVWHTS